LKSTLISFCSESESCLLDLTSKSSKYQIPIAGRFKLIDWIISASFNLGVSKIILFEKFFPMQLHDFLETYLMAGKAAETKIFPRSENTIFKDFMSVIKNEDSDMFIVYNGDNPALADFASIKRDLENLKDGACIYRVYYDGDLSEMFKIIAADKKTLIKHISELEKVDYKIPVPFETLCNTLINNGYAEKRIKGYYKQLNSISDYFTFNMEIVKNIRYFSKLFTLNPLGSYSTRGGIAKIARGSSVKNSIIAENSIVEGEVENSIIFPNVTVNKGAVIKDSIILSNNVIGKKSNLIRVIIDEATEGKPSPHPNIGNSAEVGRYNLNTVNGLFKSHLFAGITFIGKNSYIPRNIKIGSGCYIKPETDGNTFGKIDRIFDGQTV
jgi:glucose-1-phosphate adenylyltransferase